MDDALHAWMRVACDIPISGPIFQAARLPWTLRMTSQMRRRTTLGRLMDATSTYKDALSACTDDTSKMWEHRAVLDKFLQKCFIKKQQK